jgi:hypothetical protein
MNLFRSTSLKLRFEVKRGGVEVLSWETYVNDGLGIEDFDIDGLGIEGFVDGLGIEPSV